MTSRLFPRTIPSTTHEEAKQRVLSLYKQWLHEARIAIRKYPLDITVNQARSKIRQEFEKNRDEKHLAVINMMILKGTNELIETHNIWKQESQLMRYFYERDDLPPKKTFIDKFLE